MTWTVIEEKKKERKRKQKFLFPWDPGKTDMELSVKKFFFGKKDIGGPLLFPS